MRVLQLVDRLTRTGGLERFLERFSEDLVAAGYATAVVEVDPDLKIAPPKLAGIEVSRENAADFADRWHPDIILSHQSGDADLLRRLCATYRVAYLVQTVLCPGGKLFRRRDRVCDHAMGIRCLVGWYAGPCGSAVTPMTAWRRVNQMREIVHAVRGAEAVLVASEWMRGHVLQEGIDPKKVQAVDISEGIGPPAPIRPAPAGDQIKLLYVGRISYEKGVQYALRALKHLPNGYTLRVVGDGWFRPQLEKLADDLGIASRVAFDGMLSAEQTRAAYANSDVLVVTSIWPEPAGLIVPEGRAAGLRVVVFDRGGLVDWVRSGRVDHVTVAREATPPALADAILESLDRTHGAKYSLPIVSHAPPRPMLAILEEIVGRANAAVTARS